MVARLVEHQHVVLAEQQPGQAQPGPLAAGEDRDPLLHLRRRGTAGRRPGRESPGSSCRRPALYSRYSSTVCSSRQAGVNVLGVDADLAAVAPADFAGQRLERVDDRAQKRRLALAVVSDDRRPRAVVDFEIDAAGDLRVRDSRSPGRGSAGPAPCAARRPERGCWPSVRRRRSRSAPAVRAACSSSGLAWRCWPGPCSWR